MTYPSGMESCGGCFIALRGVLGERSPVLDTKLIAENITVIDPAGWYPTRIELEVLAALSPGEEYCAGWDIPDFVKLPKSENIIAAFHALDIGYHLNHRLNGQLMYDTRQWRIVEGIGNFTARADGSRAAVVSAPGPFSAHFNYGLITRVAAMHERTAQSEILEQAETYTTYRVYW
jgi:hypothetical protein